MVGQSLINDPPDWPALQKDLLCPLCGYNLRGLNESRCPECGFQFTWQELIDAARDKHPYLFEHGTGRNFKTFWRTYWHTCRPRSFWNDLNPAHAVRLIRLIVYWGLSGFLAALSVFLGDVIYFRSVLVGFIVPGQFVSNSWSDYSWYVLPVLLPAATWAVMLMVWPWLTLIALLVFRYSMRQAKIRRVHLVRTVIYSCDFGVLFAISFFATYSNGLEYSKGWLMVFAALICSIITTYRLTIAFRQYLRVHLPFATVLASQMIAFLAAFTAVTWTVGFSSNI